MKLAGNTNVGKVRAENQDRFCKGQLSPSACFALVCDGMGGAAGGATAAALACDTIQAHLVHTASECTPGLEKAFLSNAIADANKVVLKAAAQSADLAGMGTTAVCALLQDGQAFISHVGDSRCYLMRGGVLVQLTRDHSYVQGLVDYGTITPAEAETHPQRGAITRAIGADRRIEPDFTQITVVAGDMLVLCSDGLCRVLSAAKIAQILAQHPLDAAPDVLIAAANQEGGPDNITVVLVEIQATEANNG